MIDLPTKEMIAENSIQIYMQQSTSM